MNLDMEESKMVENIERPDFCLNDHLCFLDDLRDSSITNMFGAVSYILEDFPNLTKEQAREILKYWMKTFKED